MFECQITLVIGKIESTGSDVLIAEELGTLRRAQEQAVADKKKTPRKRWGVEQVSKLLRLTRVPSESELPSIYTAVAVGIGVAQDCIILQNAFVACCLEAGQRLVLPTS